MVKSPPFDFLMGFVFKMLGTSEILCWQLLEEEATWDEEILQGSAGSKGKQIHWGFFFQSCIDYWMGFFSLV